MESMDEKPQGTTTFSVSLPSDLGKKLFRFQRGLEAVRISQKGRKKKKKQFNEQIYLEYFLLVELIWPV